MFGKRDYFINQVLLITNTARAKRHVLSIQTYGRIAMLEKSETRYFSMLFPNVCSALLTENHSYHESGGAT